MECPVCWHCPPPTCSRSRPSRWHTHLCLSQARPHHNNENRPLAALQGTVRPIEKEVHYARPKTTSSRTGYRDSPGAVAAQLRRPAAPRRDRRRRGRGDCKDRHLLPATRLAWRVGEAPQIPLCLLPEGRREVAALQPRALALHEELRLVLCLR